MKPRGIQKTYIRRRTRYKVHDEKNACHLGDRVLIIETRPLSRGKRWRVKEILERAQ
jgi:small subunit ribosomal protein S17